MNKSATQEIHEWLHVEQVNKAILIDVSFSLNLSRDQQIDEWLHIEQVNHAVEVHVAKQNITVADTPAKLMT